MPRFFSHFSLLWVLCLAQPALACLQISNEEARRLTLIDQVEDARRLHQTMEAPVPTTAPETANFTPGSWAQLEAEALTRVFEGRVGAAIDLLQKAESLSPGNYSVAANLGTALELDGQNENALRWIAEALRRNPDSHSKTEWIHLLILQAKVRREHAPSAPFTSLIQLPAEFSEDTLVSVSGVTYPMQEVKRAIYYQLRERMKFVKPRDPYVADLLFTLSRIDARLYGPASAYEYVQLAERYGYHDEAKLKADKNTYFWPVLRSRVLSSLAWFFQAVAIVTAIVWPLHWLYTRLSRLGLLQFRRSS